MTLNAAAVGDGFVVRNKNGGFCGFEKEQEGYWKGPFCFVQAADTQFGMISSFMEMEEQSWEEEIRLTKQAIEAANKLEPRPRFFIVCGDLIHEMPGGKYRTGQERDFKHVFTDLHSEIPLVCVCGNHDVGDRPTKESVRAYRNSFGDDYFSFWVGGVKFIAINSQYYEDPSLVMDIKEEQDRWLDEELSEANTKDCKHLVILQHIPWFLYRPDEEKEYFNIEVPTRKHMLDKFRAAGVTKIFCGHYHRNAGGFDGEIELIVTSAIGKQLGQEKSGFRLVKVRQEEITHKYFELDDIPATVDFSSGTFNF